MAVSSAKQSREKKEMSASTAALVQLASKWSNVLVQLVVTAVLARLLTPEEYGFVAVLTVFTSFFSTISDMGISTAIVQFRDLTRKDCGSLLTFSFIAGCVMAVAFFFVSVVISFVYGDSAYIPVGAILMGSVLFNALNMVPNGMLLRDRKFLVVGVRLVVCTISVGAVTVVLAYLGLGYYAIALQSVLTSVFVFTWNMASTRVKPVLGGVRDVLQRVGKYSMYQFGHQTIGFFASNLDTLLAGKFFGSEQLGYYNKAYTVAGYPNTYLSSTISSVMHPFLSSYKDDRDALYAHFLRMVRYVSILSSWGMAVFVACANEIVLILFGSQWIPSGPLLRLLALSVWARAINGSHGPLLLAAGRSDLLMRSTLTNTIVTCLLMLVGISLGSTTALAGALAVAYNLELVVPVYLCMHVCLGKSIRSYLANFVPELVAAFAGIAAALFIPLPDMGVIPLAIMKVVLVTAVYLAIMLALGQKDKLLGMLRLIHR